MSCTIWKSRNQSSGRISDETEENQELFSFTFLSSM